MSYLVLAATRYDGPAFTERHVVDQLVADEPVTWIEPPVSWFGARRRSDLLDGRTAPGSRTVGPRLVRVFPPTPPFKDRPAVRPLADASYRATVRSVLRRTSPDVAIAFAAHWPSLDLVGPGTLRVFWAKDDLLAATALSGLQQDRVEQGLRRQLANADLVVAATSVIADRLREVRDVLLLPPGADVDAFTEVGPRPTDLPADEPLVGFVGQLTDRVDQDLLVAVADTGVQLVLVGPLGRTAEEQSWRRLIARPNVTWVGAKPYSEVPSYVRAFDVGLVPYRPDPFNAASFPLKLFEYLAGGSLVVSSDLPASRSIDDDVIYIAKTPADFADAVTRVLTRRDPDAVSRARAVAAAHSWSRRVAQLRSAISRAHAERE